MGLNYQDKKFGTMRKLSLKIRYCITHTYFDYTCILRQTLFKLQIYLNVDHFENLSSSSLLDICWINRISEKFHNSTQIFGEFDQI